MKRLVRFLFFIACALDGMAVSNQGHASGRDMSANTLAAFRQDTAHGLIGRYYSGQNFDNLKMTRIDSVIAFDWGSNSPLPGEMPVDNFSVSWSGYIRAKVSGKYTFHMRSDDGGRLAINGFVFLDYWGSCCRDFTGTVYLEAGKLYPVQFWMHEGGGGAGANYMRWEADGLPLEDVPHENLYAIDPVIDFSDDLSKRDTSNGLIGRYYTWVSGSPTSFDTLRIIRKDPQMNFDWGSNSAMPDALPIDYFSVRWEGFIRAPVSGTYTFTSWTDDGQRVYIGGTKIIDSWGSCCADRTGQINLEAGKLYPVVLEMHEIGGGAASRYLQWEAPGLAKENIPSSAYYTVRLEPVNQPQMSPVPALYELQTDVVLKPTTPGSVIHYTLDGSTPNEDSPIYTDTIHITQDTKVRAIAYHDGMIPSLEVSGTYRIIPEAVDKPTFEPAGNVYYTPQTVALVSDTGAEIHYTTDGSNPDINSPVYDQPIAVDSTMIIKAYAIKDGLSNSQVSTATYIIVKPSIETPELSVPGGRYTSSQTVSITCATPGVTIYYTVDGKEPDISSKIYTGPIKVDTSMTIKAFADKTGMKTSSVVTGIYLINEEMKTVDTPIFSIPGGQFNAVQQITLTTNTRGATIYYTTDGSEPTEDSKVFRAPISVNDTMTIKAYAVLEGLNPSPVVTQQYYINQVLSDNDPITTDLPEQKLMISPNPATDLVRISWEGLIYTHDPIRLVMTDSKGSVVMDVTVPEGDAFYQFSTRVLSSGIYYISVRSGSSGAKGKLIILR